MKLLSNLLMGGLLLLALTLSPQANAQSTYGGEVQLVAPVSGQVFKVTSFPTSVTVTSDPHYVFIYDGIPNSVIFGVSFVLMLQVDGRIPPLAIISSTGITVTLNSSGNWLSCGSGSGGGMSATASLGPGDHNAIGTASITIPGNVTLTTTYTVPFAVTK